MKLAKKAFRNTPIQKRISKFVRFAKENLETIDFPLVHRFTPGIYAREIFMPAGALVVSKIHLTEHPYVVSKGRISVWTESEGTQEIVAPFTGITKPGTRRLLIVHEDTIWTTFHATDKTDVNEIEREILMPENQLEFEEKLCLSRH